MTKTRILVVEDMSIIALGLKSKLSRMGYEVVATASSGEEAVELVISTAPDVVLMDINLKGMDGVTTAREIQQNSDTAIIFTSAYSDKKTRERADSVVAAGYISKPYEDGKLARLIDQATAQKSAGYARKSLRLDRVGRQTIDLRKQSRQCADVSRRRCWVVASIGPVAVVRCGYVYR